jgi:hypothetical protein
MAGRGNYLRVRLGSVESEPAVDYSIQCQTRPGSQFKETDPSAGIASSERTRRQQEALCLKPDNEMIHKTTLIAGT